MARLRNSLCLTLVSLGVLVRVACVFCGSLHCNLLLLSPVLLEKEDMFKDYKRQEEHKVEIEVFSHCSPHQVKISIFEWMKQRTVRFLTQSQCTLQDIFTVNF